MTGKRLSESGAHKKVLYKGQMREEYWENMELTKKYKNCTEFINKIIGRFNHFTNSGNNENYMDREAGFMQWLKNELREPELRNCYNVSDNKNLKNVKEQFKGRL